MLHFWNYNLKQVAIYRFFIKYPILGNVANKVRIRVDILKLVFSELFGEMRQLMTLIYYYFLECH